MRAILQRVIKAQVHVGGKIVGAIDKGLLVFLGVAKQDTQKDCEYLYEKIINLRFFDDLQAKMNCSALDVKAEILVVSQFTIMGECRKGRRPSFDRAMPANDAQKLYTVFVNGISSFGLKVASGQFQTMMQVHLINDGPVTLLLDSADV
ncbi:MAG: D-aminoacyl-tRNA deacylase [Chlamydiota bacterium]|nr:D-aminoacyl-tRNA deacylase [Chlamydiota bacterium]